LLEVDPGNRPDAAQARKLLTRAAPPPAHVQERLDDRRTLDLESSTLRLGRAARRTRDVLTLSLPRRVRRRPLAITAATLVTVGAVAAGLVVLDPWGSTGAGHKDVGLADARPSASARAGTMGDERTADPCGLVDAASLSRFGHTGLDPDYGEIDRCDVLVHNGSGDDIAGLQVNLDADRDDFDDVRSTRLVGNLTVVTVERDGKTCERAVLPTDGTQIRVVGRQLAPSSPDPCQLADAATDHVVGVLADGPVPRRASAPAADSLARLDACTLLDAADLTRVPGVQPANQDRGFGAWDCDWSSDDGKREVEIQFSRDNALDADDGTLVNVAGTKSYYVADEAEDESCTVRTPHRTYPDSVGDETTELFQLTVYAPRPGRQLCGVAEELAGRVVGNTAKRLPVR
jgi:hypothetical protein